MILQDGNALVAVGSLDTRRPTPPSDPPALRDDAKARDDAQDSNCQAGPLVGSTCDPRDAPLSSPPRAGP